MTKERVSGRPRMDRETHQVACYLAVALLLVGCATAPRPPRTPEQLAQDIRIYQTVQQHLDDDPNIYDRHVDISVYNGVVTLSGYVYTPYDLQQADRIAWAVPGVSRVANDLEVDILGRRGHR